MRHALGLSAALDRQPFKRAERWRARQRDASGLLQRLVESGPTLEQQRANTPGAPTGPVSDAEPSTERPQAPAATSGASGGESR